MQILFIALFCSRRREFERAPERFGVDDFDALIRRAVAEVLGQSALTCFKCDNDFDERWQQGSVVTEERFVEFVLTFEALFSLNGKLFFAGTCDAFGRH